MKYKYMFIIIFILNCFFEKPPAKDEDWCKRTAAGISVLESYDQQFYPGLTKDESAIRAYVVTYVECMYLINNTN